MNSMPLILAFVLISGLALAEDNQPSVDQLIRDALDNKKALVEEEFNDCMAKAPYEDRCRNLIKALWAREKEHLAIIARAMTLPQINMEVLSSEIRQCRPPDQRTYSNYITCIRLLAVRIDRALKGEMLVKAAANCTTLNNEKKSAP